MSEQDFSEGIETAARWHDQQAARYRFSAPDIRARGINVENTATREYLRLILEHDEVDASRHEHHAKAIRALAAELSHRIAAVASVILNISEQHDQTVTNIVALIRAEITRSRMTPQFEPLIPRRRAA